MSATTSPPATSRASTRVAATILAAALSAVFILPAQTAVAADDPGAQAWTTISGSGSTWAQNAVEQWRYDLAVNAGMTINYSGTGALAGRTDFTNGTADFAISELPYQTAPTQGPTEVAPADFAYVPIAAGATSLAYNLWIDGTRVTDLRLSGDVTARIFAGSVVNWNDPAIQADNPQLRMPDRPLRAVVRSDASGSSAQFTEWLAAQHPTIWTAGVTQTMPVPAGGVAQPGSNGVAGYIGQAYGEGSIGYLEYATALDAGLTTAKVRNGGGYYVAPSANAASIALLSAGWDAAGVAQFSGAYRSTDPRAYPLPNYAALLVPTAERTTFTAAKGRTLAAFATYAVCAGQQRAGDLGYAPLPFNAVEQAARGISRIPGAAPFDLVACTNPTFAPGDTAASNTLLRDATMPPAADRYVDPTDTSVHEEDLTAGLNTLTFDVTAGSAVITVSGGPSVAGKTLKAGAFPGPTLLGLVAFNGAGSATLDFADSGLTVGDGYKLYLAESDGTVVAWGSFTMPAGSAEEPDPGSGRFELIAPTIDSIDWGAVHRGSASAPHRLGAFTVIDDRTDHPGWSLQVDVDDFTHDTDVDATVSNAALGFAPLASGLPAGIALSAQEHVAGSAVYSAIVATGAPGSKTGPAGVAFDAELRLKMPSDAKPGTYRSTLTLTLTSP